MEAFLTIGIEYKSVNYSGFFMDYGNDAILALKVAAILRDSEIFLVDLSAEEHVSILNYGWEICNRYINRIRFLVLAGSNPPSVSDKLSSVIKRLTQCSLNMWFSQEWLAVRAELKEELIASLQYAHLVYGMWPEFSGFNWSYVLNIGTDPWGSIAHIKSFFINANKPEVKYFHNILAQKYINDDFAFVTKEGVFLVVLRLIQMLNAGHTEEVKVFSLRIIVVCYHYIDDISQRTDDDSVNTVFEYMRCVVFLCHVYLMTVYETDEENRLTIDNLLRNIRFYCENFDKLVTNDEAFKKCMAYPVAFYIAMICKHLNMRSIDLFNAFIFDSFGDYSISLFGAIAQTYKSYLLSNYLIVLNNTDSEDFRMNLDHYKRMFDFYVLERERGEMYLQRELQKQQQHRKIRKKNIKGNRMIHTGSYGLSDSANSIDIIFQTMPDNAQALNHVYEGLDRRYNESWNFPKIVLLIKIICHEYNEIELWRYHPGLTTEFMMSLEKKLSRHFENLARIFKEHPFMEQEFWLTAFYLDPNPKYYRAVLRCGVRNNRRRQLVGAKFGLLSTTVDVEEIVALSNNETLSMDYESLLNALRSLRLPASTVKDLLTVIFHSRNKKFTWAVGWYALQRRCTDLLKTVSRKRHFVELNMAEANERLKFVKIDYDAFQDRPQMNYGTIEMGYKPTQSNHLEKSGDAKEKNVPPTDKEGMDMDGRQQGDGIFADSRGSECEATTLEVTSESANASVNNKYVGSTTACGDKLKLNIDADLRNVRSPELFNAEIADCDYDLSMEAIDYQNDLFDEIGLP